MQKEKLDCTWWELSNETLAVGVKTWAVDLGVTTALLDLDDTLCDTSALFWNAIEDYWRNMERITGGKQRLAFEECVKWWKGVFAGMREVFVVHPSITDYTAYVIAKEYGVRLGSRDLVEALEQLQIDIYYTEPTIYEDVDRTLRIFKQAGLDSRVGTIALEPWTWRKLKVIDRFSEEEVCCFEVTEPKQGQWVKGLRKFGVAGHECVIVGDNYEEDIVPMLELGARRGYWVAHGREERRLMLGVIRIEEFKDLLPAILSQSQWDWRSSLV